MSASSDRNRRPSTSPKRRRCRSRPSPPTKRCLRACASGAASVARPFSRRLGADHVIHHHQELAAQLDALSTPVDYVLCTADTDPYFEALAALVAPEGTLCFIVPPTR